MAVLSSPHASGRIDWKDIRDRVDLAPVAIALLGPAPGRRGEHGRRLWWRCPFHEDGNPSFCVEPGKPWWRCYGCGERGNAPKLVMKLNGVGFPEAIRWITEVAGIATALAKNRGRKPSPPMDGEVSDLRPGLPEKAPDCPPGQLPGLSRDDCRSLVRDAADQLWKPEGRQALAYLHGRYLTDETIRAACLGVAASVSIPTREADRCYRARGVVIPWLDGDRLALVKIRQPEGSKPKYAEAYRDQPTIFPSPTAVRPGQPLIIVEGEFDCLLLGQTIGMLASVVTLGSASNRPDSGILALMLTAPVWFIATDADDAGDRSASWWPARARRVKPPGPNKDWTEAAQAGVDLRRWWSDRLAGTEAPPLFSWEELAAWRWGPARDDPTPGIIIDHPDPACCHAALEAADPADDYALAERVAIQEENR